MKKWLKNILAITGILGLGMALFLLFLPYGVYLEYHVKFNPKQAWAFVATKAPIEYSINVSEADQGVTGSGRTIKAFVDAIGGTRKATIKILHTEKTTFSTYTVTTNETITSNIAFEVDHGATLDGAGTLTINGPFEHGPSQCFGSSITVIFGNGAVDNVYLEWRGGSADNSTDNLAAFDKTQDSLSSGGRIDLLSGTYQTSAVWNIDTNGIEIRGQNRTTIIKTTSGTANIIEIGDGTTPSVKYITISGIYFNATGVMTDGAAIAILGGSYVNIDNIFVTANVYDGVQFSGPDNDHYTYHLTRFTMVPSHIALHFTDDTMEIFISNGNILASDYGIYMEYCQGVYIDTVTMYDCDENAVKMVPGAGEAVKNIFMDEVVGDYSDKANWVFDSSGGGAGCLNAIHLDSCWCSSAGHQDAAAYNGVDILGANLVGLTIDNMHCYASGAHGINLNAVGSSKISILNSRIWGHSQQAANTYDGISIVAGQTYFTISGNTIGSSGVNQEYGIDIATGGSNKYIITGNTLYGNTTGAIRDLGTGSEIIVEDNLPRGSGGWGGVDLTVADDTAISFTPRFKLGTLLVTIDGTNSGMLSYTAVGGGAATLKLAGDAKFTVTTGVLAGNTGADLDLTVSSHTDGKIYIENRLGSTKAIDYQVISGR